MYDSKNISRLQKIQNRCVRLIFKNPKITHASPLLHDLHWLPVSHCIKFRTLVHVFKHLSNLSPVYRFPLHPEIILLFSPFIKRHFMQYPLTGDHAFSVSAPRLRPPPFISQDLHQHHVFQKAPIFYQLHFVGANENQLLK